MRLETTLKNDSPCNTPAHLRKHLQLTTYHWRMLNERLKNLRLAKGLTLQQVGDAFGISAASVASWEKGKNQPDSRKINKIAQVLGTSVEFLLNGSGDYQVVNNESLVQAVAFVPWDKLLNYFQTVSIIEERVSPLHTHLSSKSFATRFPGSNELSWGQGPIPAGALIFIDPEIDLQTDALVLVSLESDKLEFARVQLPAKQNGYYLKLINSSVTVQSSKEAKVIGSVKEWRISGKL
jgi:transcriptional regulator with XRE-family HTH domain